jgi:hypothetical protein
MNFYKLREKLIKLPYKCECGHAKRFHGNGSKGTCTKCPCWFYKEVKQ